MRGLWRARASLRTAIPRTATSGRRFTRGKGIGKDLAVKFAPVTARIVRLNITEGRDGPTIFEFQLFCRPPNHKVGARQ